MTVRHPGYQLARDLDAWFKRLYDDRHPKPPGLRPGAETCWCCGATGDQYKPGWLECRAHPEGPVRWYGGTVPLVISNGVRRRA